MGAKVIRPFIDHDRSYSAGDDFGGDADRIGELVAHGLVEEDIAAPREPKKKDKKDKKDKKEGRA